MTNRIVITDINDKVRRIRTDSEIVKENEELENALKQKVEEAMTVMMVEQQDRSVNFGVVGVGQCGSRIAEEFYSRGYNVIAINTAMQDLKHINVPEKYKMFLDYTLGGAAKDLETGRAATEEYADQIEQILRENFENNEILILATSGGGGTGSGAAEAMINIMSRLGKPVVAIYVLPLASEDTLAKHNAIQTLAKLAKMAKEDVINSLVVVDNAKIELLHPGKSMAEFWKVANEAIVEPLHLFNKLSSNASGYTSLDPMDFSKVLIGTGDCALYGSMDVPNYIEEEAIAEAMIANLEKGLLASDFNLSQTRAAGVIITGSKEVLSKLPANNLEYGFSMISKICNEGTVIYRGVYEVPTNDNILRVYSFFSGLGLPEERVNELKIEAERHMQALQNKEDSRSTTMSVDMGKTGTVSAVDAMHKRIKDKHSAMGKLKNNTKRIVDKRRT